jgi:hypothetical protein
MRGGFFVGAAAPPRWARCTAIVAALIAARPPLPQGRFHRGAPTGPAPAASGAVSKMTSFTTDAGAVGVTRARCVVGFFVGAAAPPRWARCTAIVAALIAARPPLPQGRFHMAAPTGPAPAASGAVSKAPSFTADAGAVGVTRARCVVGFFVGAAAPPRWARCTAIVAALIAARPPLPKGRSQRAASTGQLPQVLRQRHRAQFRR